MPLFDIDFDLSDRFNLTFSFTDNALGYYKYIVDKYQIVKKCDINMSKIIAYVTQHLFSFLLDIIINMVR